MTNPSPTFRPAVFDRLLIAAAGFGVLIIVAAAVGVLPGGAVITRHIPHGDWLVHGLVYGTLATAAAILTPRAVMRVPRTPGPAGTPRSFVIPIALPVVLLIALGEELLQGRDPARRLSLGDAAANTLGILVLAPLVLAFRARLAVRTSSRGG
jgi:hypothetical protein